MLTIQNNKPNESNYLNVQQCCRTVLVKQIDVTIPTNVYAMLELERRLESNVGGVRLELELQYNLHYIKLINIAYNNHWYNITP